MPLGSPQAGRGRGLRPKELGSESRSCAPGLPPSPFPSLCHGAAPLQLQAALHVWPVPHTHPQRRGLLPFPFSRGQTEAESGVGGWRVAPVLRGGGDSLAHGHPKGCFRLPSAVKQETLSVFREDLEGCCHPPPCPFLALGQELGEAPGLGLELSTVAQCRILPPRLARDEGVLGPLLGPCTECCGALPVPSSACSEGYVMAARPSARAQIPSASSQGCFPTTCPPAHSPVSAAASASGQHAAPAPPSRGGSPYPTVPAAGPPGGQRLHPRGE